MTRIKMETIIELNTVSWCFFAIVSVPSFVAEAHDPGTGLLSHLQCPQRCERALVQKLRSDG